MESETMDTASELHLADVHPELARRIRLLNDKCEANGIPIRVTCGLRTWNEQDALYAQGRTASGNIVTNAPGGYSAHQFSYACDIVPGKEGMPAFTPDWNAMDLSWKWVLLLAEQCNLAEGAEWRMFPDRPHLYLKELPATPDDEMRYAFKEGGMDAIRSLINSRLAAG
jgi:peptidoglycan L-alanyl-D-glutamate endopeptidase CwlK